MTLDEITEYVSSFADVHVQRAAPDDGSPEIAWGDIFFYYSPEGSPVGQPFATITTKDYPGEPASGLDRPGAFRLNVQASKDVVDRTGVKPTGDVDRSAVDEFAPHPTYPGWLTVIEPGERTSGQVRELLNASHTAAAERHERRTS